MSTQTGTAVHVVRCPYVIELTEEERANLLIALGGFAGLVMHRGGELPSACADLTRKIAASQPRQPATVTASVSREVPIGPGKEAAAAILSPPATPPTVPVDHWIKKKPDTWETIEAPITKIETRSGANGDFLRITFPNQGRGLSYASVFDEALFPAIRTRLDKRTIFYVVKSGKYLNVVGVRA